MKTMREQKLTLRLLIFSLLVLKLEREKDTQKFPKRDIKVNCF